MSKPGKNAGEANFRNKIKIQDALFIRDCTTMTQVQLGKKFGISQSAVNHIKHGRTWKQTLAEYEKARKKD